MEAERNRDYYLELVSRQSEKEINDINQYIFRLARGKEISSYLVIMPLLMEVFIIGTILKNL